MIVMPRTGRTERLALRPPTVADAAAVFAFAGDAEVTRYLDWPTHDVVADSRLFIDDIAAGWDAGDDFTWVLEYGETPRVIGTAGCQFDAHGAQLGYLLARAYWNRGLATEAVASILQAACAIDEVHRFWATCDPDNHSSARVLEKVGLKREAILARWSPRPNMAGRDGPGDALVYAWTR